MFEKQKGLLEVTKLKEISSRKLKENIEEISQKEQNQKTVEGREAGQQERKYKRIELCGPTSKIIEAPGRTEKIQRKKLQNSQNKKISRTKEHPFLDLKDPMSTKQFLKNKANQGI